jgi:hypothetical protein
MIRWAALGLALAAASAGHAQIKMPPKPENGASAKPSEVPSKTVNMRTLQLTLPADGDYFFRFLPSADAKDPAQIPIGFHDRTKAISVPEGVLGSQPRFAVDDVKTGNSAIRPLGKEDKVELRTLDFDHVRRVEILVTYENRPVAAAKVELTADGAKPVTKVLDATAKGVAAFDDVKAGKAKLTLTYGDNFSETRDVNISTDHPAGTVQIPAAVSNKVPTTEPVPAAKPVEKEAPKASSPAAEAASTAADRPGGVGSFIGSLVALAVVAGVLYGLYRWSQTGGMAATLKKVGIETAGPVPASDAGTPWAPNRPAPPVVADPTLCQFCGMKKDAAGGCACTVGGGGAVASGGGLPTGVPRLIATVGVYSGSIFELSAAMVTIGRDVANPIALPNDNTVSRKHATLKIENGGAVLVDEGSANGVYVNGVKVTGSQSVRPGDEVQIGGTRFRFEC